MSTEHRPPAQTGTTTCPPPVTRASNAEPRRTKVTVRELKGPERDRILAEQAAALPGLCRARTPDRRSTHPQIRSAHPPASDVNFQNQLLYACAELTGVDCNRQSHTEGLRFKSRVFYSPGSR